MAKQSGSDEELGCIVEEAVVALGKLPDAKILKAAKASAMFLFGPKANTLAEDRRALKDLYASAADVRRAIDARTPEIKAMVVDLLVEASPDEAAVYLPRIAMRDLTGYAFGTWEMDILYTLSPGLLKLGPKIAPSALLELLFVPRIPDEYVPEGTFAKLSIEDIVRLSRRPDAFLYGHATRLLKEHAGMRDGATVLTLFGQLPEARRDLRQKLVDRLGELRFAPALPALLDAKGVHTLSALSAIDSPEVRRALAEQLPAYLDASYTQGVRVAVRAATADEPGCSSETLAAYFSDEALTTSVGRRRAALILDARCAAPKAEPVLHRDPRWTDVAARLLHGPSFESAREFLATFDAKDVKAALKRAGYAAPAAPAPKTHPLPKKPRWLVRYDRGEHEAVWAEIVALEDSAQDPAVLEEATAVAHAMMGRVRQNLEALVELLKKRKYRFAVKSAKKALLLPHAKAATQMKALEKIAGASLPLSLRAFWEVVGSVDLTELDAAGDPAEGLGAMDPLLVVPPDLSLALVKGRADHEKRLPAELRRSIREMTIGLDPMVKHDLGEDNDAPYEIEILGSRADGVVRQGDREMTFVGYLRAAIAAGGFPGSPAPDDPERDPLKVRALLAKGRIAF